MEQLSLINPDNFIGDNSKYGVPRVNDILSAMLHEDYLMKWSNAIGFKHQSYKDTLESAAYVGTCVHEAIENFLMNGEYINHHDYDCTNEQCNKIHNAFLSFTEWWDIILKTSYEILLQEKTLICKYFGGTLDMLIKINGKMYLVDFKTSNSSSYKHFLQLSAYRYLLKECENIEVDGCIILMLDKNEATFTEKVLDFSIPEHIQFMNNCEECFLSLVYSYYTRSIVQTQFNNIFGGKRYGKINKSDSRVQGSAKQSINKALQSNKIYQK